MRRTRVMLAMVLMMVMVILVLTGCGGNGSSGANGEAAGEEAPQVMIIGLQSDGTTLDPHAASDAASMRLIENMYSTLVRYADGTYGDIEPDLAASYDISDDGKTYTFTLRNNAVFHREQRPVTAEDVKYSIERIIDMEVRAYMFSEVSSIEIVDEHTLAIHMSAPFAPFLTYLANPMNAVVDREVAEAEGLDQADGGSGPFMLVEWLKDQHVTMEKNPDYYMEGLPKLDQVTYRPIPDETARVVALQNNEIHLLLDITYKDAEQLENKEGIVIDTVPGTFWEYLGINTKEAPLDDVRVRQAIAHALDRDSVNDVVKFGRATPLTGGVIPPGHWAALEEALYPAQNLEKARELLADAGYAEGISLELKAGSAFQYQVDAAQMIKQQLEAAGIEVNVVAQESGIFFDGLGNHDFQLAVVGWLGFVDPDEFLYNIFYTGAPWNQQMYSNETLDSLLEEGRQETDFEKRAEIYREAQRIISQEAPMAFLYVNESSNARRESVKDFEVNPMVTTLSLRQAWIQ